MRWYWTKFNTKVFLRQTALLGPYNDLWKLSNSKVWAKVFRAIFWPKNDQKWPKSAHFLTRLLCKLKSCAWSQTNRNCQLYIRAPLQICPKMYRLALIGQLSNYYPIRLTPLLYDVKSCAWSQTNPNCRLYIRAPLQICPKIYRLALIGQLSN